MEKKELIKGMTYLGVATGKEYTQDECEVYYNFLKEYDYQIFVKAIKKKINSLVYQPRISELVEECKYQTKSYYKNIIDKMYKDNYFKSDEEYGRAAMQILTEGIVPEWLKNDMISYEENETKLIGGQ